MAANMPQMAGNGHMMQNGQRQLQAAVFSQLTNNPIQLQGWQAAVNVTDRFGKIMNLYVLNLLTAMLPRLTGITGALTGNCRISNLILAMPAADWQKAASMGLEFEKKALLNSPDRVSSTPN